MGTKDLNKQAYNLSEGEIFIAEYFESENIKFKEQVSISNLKFDSKTFRKPDFYLPRYKVYVEFFGMWNNSKEERERYREKKGIYYKNHIPCVYLYPENLGIIDFTFPMRLRKELRRHSMGKELFIFQLKMLLNDRGSLFFWLILSTIVLFFGQYDLNNDRGIIICVVGIILYQIWRLIIGYRLFFK
jgi:hypothetical protein